jgi:hypothetical protein
VFARVPRAARRPRQDADARDDAQDYRFTLNPNAIVLPSARVVIVPSPVAAADQDRPTYERILDRDRLNKDSVRGWECHGVCRNVPRCARTAFPDA